MPLQSSPLDVAAPILTVPPLPQQIPAEQQVLSLRREDLQCYGPVVAGRLEPGDLGGPVRVAPRGRAQRQMLVGRAVVLGEVDVEQLLAQAVEVLIPAVLTPLQLGVTAVQVEPEQRDSI